MAVRHCERSMPQKAVVLSKPMRYRPLRSLMGGEVACYHLFLHHAQENIRVQCFVS